MSNQIIVADNVDLGNAAGRISVFIKESTERITFEAWGNSRFVVRTEPQNVPIPGDLVFEAYKQLPAGLWLLWQQGTASGRAYAQALSDAVLDSFRSQG